MSATRYPARAGIMLFCVLITSAAGLPAVAAGDWPGGGRPGPEVGVFAAGVISTDLAERDLSVAASGDWLAYTIMVGRQGVIVLMHRQDGRWQAPSIAPFSGAASDLEPFFAPDGRLYFASQREPVSEQPNYDIWSVGLADNQWGEPVRLGAEINTDANEFYPALNRAGDIFFTATRENGVGDEDIFVCRRDGSGYLPAVPVPGELNTSGPEFNATVSPDDDFILFSAWGRPDSAGGGDLYVSYRLVDGTYGRAVDLPFNSPALDYCPSLSPDGRILFFSSKRSGVVLDRQQNWTLDRLGAALRRPLNGAGDIFWVKMADWRPRDDG